MFERRYPPNLAVVRAIDELYAPGAEPDVIHTHAAMPSLVALVFAGARRTPIRIVQTMHGWGIVKTAEQVATDVALLNLVDRVMVPSAATAETLASLGVAPVADHSRALRRWTGIGRARRPRSSPDRSHGESASRWGSRGGVLLGTFGARKHQALLVDALASRRSEVFAVLVGDGDDGRFSPTSSATRRCRSTSTLSG